MGLVEGGLEASHIVTFNPDPAVGLELLLSQGVSLPLGEGVKCLKVLPRDAIVLEPNFRVRLEESVLNSSATRNEERRRDSLKVEALTHCLEEEGPCAVDALHGLFVVKSLCDLFSCSLLHDSWFIL